MGVYVVKLIGIKIFIFMMIKKIKMDKWKYLKVELLVYYKYFIKLDKLNSIFESYKIFKNYNNICNNFRIEGC